MSFTTDATSGIGVPANSTEWGDTSISPYFDVPDHLWLCQEAANTSLADSIGSVTLTKTSNAMLWQQAITGWSRKGILISAASGGTVNGFTTSSSTLHPTSQSVMWMYYMLFNGTPTADTSVIQIGGTVATTQTFARCLLKATTPRLTCGVANLAEVSGAHDPNGFASFNGVQPVIVQYDRTNQIYRLFCGQEIITDSSFPVFDGTATKVVGSLNSTPCGPFYILYGAAWVGSKAEKTDWQIRQGLDALNWGASTSTFFPVTFTASLITSGLAIDDRIDEAVTSVVGISESETTSGSVGAVMQAAPAPTDTLSLGESISPIVSAVQGLAEETDTAESTSAVYSAATPVSETLSSSAAMGGIATYVANVGVSDPLTFTDSLGTSVQLFFTLTDSVSTNELVDVQAIITQVANAVSAGDYMGYIEQGDTLRFTIVTTDRLGEAVDADTTPTITIYKQGSALGYSPSPTHKATGVYEFALACTSGNSFDTDKEYSTYISATITGLVVPRPGPSFFIQKYTTDDIMSRLGALMKRNSVLDGGSGHVDVVRNTDGIMTSARLRIFADGTDLTTVTRGAADGADNETHRYLFGASEDSTGRMGNAFMQVQLEPA